MYGPSGSGGASTASAAIACMGIAVHGFSSGLTHTDEQRRPPGLSTRANSAVALATSLVVAGACDEVTPPERAAEIADRVSGARLAVIPECGHLSTLEQ